jgi:hypothetical protein
MLSGFDQTRQGSTGASVVAADEDDRQYLENQQAGQRFMREGVETFGEDSTFRRVISETAPSVGASIPSMLPAIAGAVTAPATGGASIAAGMAGSGALAYRGQAYREAMEYLQAENEKSLAEKGRPITVEEEKQILERYAPNIRQSAMAEAVFEGIGNAVGAGLGSSIAKQTFRNLTRKALGEAAQKQGTGILTKLATSRIGKTTGILGSETATEVPTAIVQDQSTRGTLREATPDDQLDFTPQGVYQAAAEVAPAILGTIWICVIRPSCSLCAEAQALSVRRRPRPRSQR